MSLSEADQARLLTSARAWFDRDDQVASYAGAATEGASALEADLLHRLPPPPSRVLDLGCGAGRIAVPLALAGYDVTGVEVSERQLAAARAHADDRGARATWQTVLATELPFPDASFEAVLSIKQYCYLPGAELRRAYLTEVRRVLRPGGLLILSSHIVPSEAEAASALADDRRHREAAERFAALEPLDTFSAGEGFVHWFTQDQLVDEVSSLGSEPEVVRDGAALHIGLVVSV